MRAERASNATLPKLWRGTENQAACFPNSWAEHFSALIQTYHIWWWWAWVALGIDFQVWKWKCTERRFPFHKGNQNDNLEFDFIWWMKSFKWLKLSVTLFLFRFSLKIKLFNWISLCAGSNLANHVKVLSLKNCQFSTKRWHQILKLHFFLHFRNNYHHRT